MQQRYMKSPKRLKGREPMYIPKHFIVEDQETILKFIENNSFGIIISAHKGIPFASHLPLMLDREKGCLYGHFARPNSQWEDIVGQEVLVIFHGPHHYVSPSWYETKDAVPTWNYVTVHVYGEIEIMEDFNEILDDLNEMVLKYEDPTSSYRIDEGNQGFVHGLTKGIVGFELKIKRLEGKWKLSQNHSKERQERVISNLEQMESDHAYEIVKLMKKNIGYG